MHSFETVNERGCFFFFSLADLVAGSSSTSEFVRSIIRMYAVFIGAVFSPFFSGRFSSRFFFFYIRICQINHQDVRSLHWRSVWSIWTIKVRPLSGGLVSNSKLRTAGLCCATLDIISYIKSQCDFFCCRTALHNQIANLMQKYYCISCMHNGVTAIFPHFYGITASIASIANCIFTVAIVACIIVASSITRKLLEV